MLVETILAILIVSVITSTALGLFSNLLFNFHVHNLTNKINMCIATKSSDYLDFDYKEEDEQTNILGPITNKAQIIAKALQKIQENYNCEFKDKNGEKLSLSQFGNKNITGYFWVGIERVKASI